MWFCDKLCVATWREGAARWTVDASGGLNEISILDVERAHRWLEFCPVDTDRLPAADEQYVRGNQWHVNYPQGDHSYALRLAFCPIEATASRLVMEVTVSIQTSLLDSHPKIDIDVDCQDIDSLVPDDPWADNTLGTPGSAPISIAKSNGHWIAVILGPHDSPFTTNHSTDSLLRLRLFGDFLEKGVIRRARPWIVIDRSGEAPKESELIERYRQLCESPLPLA